MKSSLFALVAAPVLALSACGGSAPPGSTGPGTPAATAPSGEALDPNASLSTKRENVTFTAGGRTIPGTIVAPTEAGSWPAVLILAGSGPTDRDWTSPLLPGTNGSAALLAEELAKRGAVVLRFDKAGAGANPGPPLDQLSLDTYRDEARSALTLLRSRPDVRVDRIFVAGHSEGAVHATRLAQVAGDQLAGVIYLAPASRSMADTIVSQLEHQLKNPLAGLTPAQVDAELAGIRKAFADFRDNRPVDPTQVSTLPPVQKLVAGIISPATAGLARDLLFFENAAQAATLEEPMLVVGGGKDIQVDVEADIRHLERALRTAQRDVTVNVAPDADHVLKHEPKSMAELRANVMAVQTAYNADGRTLDPGAVDAIVAWLAART